LKNIYFHFNLNSYCLGTDPGTLLFAPTAELEDPPNPFTISSSLPINVFIPKALFFPFADYGLSLPYITFSSYFFLMSLLFRLEGVPNLLMIFS
jgi:hypothetical protein